MQGAARPATSVEAEIVELRSREAQAALAVHNNELLIRRLEEIVAAAAETAALSVDRATSTAEDFCASAEGPSSFVMYPFLTVAAIERQAREQQRLFDEERVAYLAEFESLTSQVRLLQTLVASRLGDAQ